MVLNTYVSITNFFLLIIPLSFSVDLPPSNGFLIIEANGGLNQQRLSVSLSKRVLFSFLTH